MKRHKVNIKYGNPPIVEALCEFQFIPSPIWDMTIPGLLYEKIKERFPEKRQQLIYGGGFQIVEGGVQNQVAVMPRMQFLNPEKTALVQVDRDLFAVNHLRPYPKWETFKPLILDNLKEYQEIAQPKGLRRIGLRYINKIGFDKEPIELQDYFNYYPFIPEKLPKMHEATEVRVQISYEENRLFLTLATTTPEKPNGVALLLDLDYVMILPERIALDHVSDWMEKAHTTIEEAFEACITDKCRALFKEGK